MSFVKTQTLSKSTLYPSLDIAIENGEESVEVTYTADSIMSMSGTDTVVAFRVTIGGSVAPSMVPYAFTYSGSGDVLAEAEVSYSNMLGG